LLAEIDSYELEDLDYLRKEIAIGLEELEQSERIPAAQVFEELRQISEARRKAMG
jgi:hypothetical protein